MIDIPNSVRIGITLLEPYAVGDTIEEHMLGEEGRIIG
jgi:hypothetical protein